MHSVCNKIDRNMWVEKYRPNKLDDIVEQNNIINFLKNALITKNIPHLIFFGPSGCGKTSTILALAKELFGNDHYKERIIELNASDERGINMIRDKIKIYAKQSVNNLKNAPPWKIIILDEADTMTPDSQFALRRIMEQYSKITRFCIICNYHHKIIEPIISRCSLFRFKPINNIDLISKLNNISYIENINCSEIILSKIIDISRGDLRKAINLLQKCYNIYGDKFNNELLDEISGIIPINKFNILIENILKKNMDFVDKYINQLYLDGYSLVNQILLFHNYIIKSDLNSNIKAQICFKIIEIDQQLIKGSDEFIQFMNLVYFIMKVI
jgi:replication factor C subunit 2/4